MFTRQRHSTQTVDFHFFRFRHHHRRHRSVFLTLQRSHGLHSIHPRLLRLRRSYSSVLLEEHARRVITQRGSFRIFFIHFDGRVSRIFFQARRFRVSRIRRPTPSHRAIRFGVIVRTRLTLSTLFFNPRHRRRQLFMGTISFNRWHFSLFQVLCPFRGVSTRLHRVRDSFFRRFSFDGSFLFYFPGRQRTSF